MRIHLRNAVVFEDSLGGRRYLQCSLSVDAEWRDVTLEIVSKGGARMLVLDTWSWIDLLSNQRAAFQQMREWLFFPVNGLPLPESAFVDV